MRALDGLDLDVEAGEVLAVLGVSGSGKTTLLSLLGALDRPSAGSLEVAGLDLGRATDRERVAHRRHQVGFVFQQFHLLPSISALENVALGLTLQGVAGRERSRRSEEALAWVGLSHRARHRPGELSGGEQQRVALARALARRPRLLLADEPTGNLDRATSEAIGDLLGRARGELGATVVLATHDERLAAKADRVLRLQDGRRVEAPG